MANEQYKTMLPVWKMCEDAAAGERFVHAAGQTYLPRLKGESAKSYLVRKSMTPWFGATWRTIIVLRGMIFRVDPVVEVEQILIDNIDNSGKSLTTFAKEVVLEVLKTSRAGIFVEYPDTSDSITQAGTVGARPYLSLFKAIEITDWGTRIVSGVELLDKVQLIIDAENQLLLALDNGGVYYQQQIKVGKNGHRISEEAPVYPKMNGKVLTHIPFQFIGADQLTHEITEPALIDLITMNFHHYRQSSSYERGCFLSGLPSLFLYGPLDQDTVYLGGDTGNKMTDPQCRAEFVEVKSNFQALLDNLSQKERMMAVLGARMLEDTKKTAETEQTVARRQSGEESVLADIAATCEAGILNALRWCTEWLDKDPGKVVFRLNRQFIPADLTSQQITSLMTAYIQGGISYDTLFYNFRKAGMYPPNTDKDAERGAIGEL